MTSSSTSYICEGCGERTLVQVNVCKSCGLWGQCREDTGSSKQRFGPSEIADIDETTYQRLSTSIDSVDAVLGGGFVRAEVVLISGEPGIGKSTLLLQIADGCKGRVLYISGEETAGQIAQRARRLNITREGLQVFATTDLDRIGKVFEKGAPPKLVIVDSIQTVRSAAHSGTMGSVTQLREVTTWLIQQAKRSGIPFVLVGHVTKSGDVAGPKAVEHLVDAVLSFEQDKEGLRTLYASKNRYGSTSVSATFMMEPSGLHPALLDSAVSKDRPVGCAYTVALVNGGYRLGEVQALVEPGNPNNPQRTFEGLDNTRGKRLVATIQRHLEIDLSDKNLFLTVDYDDSSADLAICAAVWSAVNSARVSGVFAGEVLLTGEIRSARGAEMRKQVALSRALTYYPDLDNTNANLADVEWSEHES